MIIRGSTFGYTSRRKFHKKIKFLCLSIVCGVSICFCLTRINFDFDFIGVSTDYVSWFRANRNISAFLQLQEETYLAVPKDFLKLNFVSDDESVAYFVTTSPNHYAARNAVRNTWARHLKPPPIFLTGYVENYIEMDFLYNEAKLYNDIIIENFLDTYTNLTLKTGFIFKHFLRLFPNAKYLMKTDDDVLVNTDKIKMIVKDSQERYNGKQMPIIGRLYQANYHKPHRDPESKWFIPHWMYGKDYLPGYVSGTGYLVPGTFVRGILETASHIPLLPLEDVYFTGLVASNTLKIPLIHNDAFVDVKPVLPHYCSFRKLATVHHFDPSELINIWNIIHNDNFECDRFVHKIYEYIFG